MSSRQKCTHHSRREMMFAAALSSLCVSLQNETVFADEKPLRFGLTPVFLNDDLELLMAIRTYLGAATGLPISLITRRTYQEITALLVSGQLDAAWICGYPFVKYRNSLQLIAVPEWNGKPLYQSYLIAHADRAVGNIEGLRHDIHAFSDPDSNSGYLVTKALLHAMGADADGFFKKTLFTYAHRNVIRAVASGLTQSGSVDGYVWEVMREIDPDLVSRTRVVRKSEWFGFPPVAANRASAGKPAILALQNALIESERSPEGRAMLNHLRLSGFTQPQSALYDGIAENVTALKGLL